MKSPCRLTPSLGWMAVVGLACVGCVSGPRPLTVGQRDAIQRRAETWFTKAMLLKPCEPVFTNDLGFRLSPLIVQELAPAEAIALSNASPLILLFTEDQTLVGGQLHQQVSFVWQQPVGGRRGAETSATWQGLRLTLNAAGQPAIWEVLRDSSGADVVFVSQSTETAAMRAFGPSSREPSLGAPAPCRRGSEIRVAAGRQGAGAPGAQGDNARLDLGGSSHGSSECAPASWSAAVPCRFRESTRGPKRPRAAALQIAGTPKPAPDTSGVQSADLGSGELLPGRPFAVERAVEEAANVVVARIIDDGPMPMGPIVHLDLRGDITTVNCRCMATQARQLVGQGGYGLVADPSAGETWSRRGSSSGSGHHLDQVLRLPSGF